MKKNSLLIIVVLFNLLAYSQNVINYNYVINNNPYKSKPYTGMEFEFTIQKKEISESEFGISKLFTGNKKFTYFKKQNKILYYKSQKKWKLFYDFNTKRGGDILISGVKYHLIFNKKLNIRDFSLDRVYLKPSKLTQLHQFIYYFDENEGVLVMKTSNGKLLVRKDFFEVPLSEDEELLLLN